MSRSNPGASEASELATLQRNLLGYIDANKALIQNTATDVQGTNLRVSKTVSGANVNIVTYYFEYTQKIKGDKGDKFMISIQIDSSSPNREVSTPIIARKSTGLFSTKTKYYGDVALPHAGKPLLSFAESESVKTAIANTYTELAQLTPAAPAPAAMRAPAYAAPATGTPSGLGGRSLAAGLAPLASSSAATRGSAPMALQPSHASSHFNPGAGASYFPIPRAGAASHRALPSPLTTTSGPFTQQGARAPVLLPPIAHSGPQQPAAHGAHAPRAMPPASANFGDEEEDDDSVSPIMISDLIGMLRQISLAAARSPLPQNITYENTTTGFKIGKDTMMVEVIGNQIGDRKLIITDHVNSSIREYFDGYSTSDQNLHMARDLLEEILSSLAPTPARASGPAAASAATRTPARLPQPPAAPRRTAAATTTTTTTTTRTSAAAYASATLPQASAAAPAATAPTSPSSIQPLSRSEKDRVAAGYTLQDRQITGGRDQHGKARNRANDLYGSTQHQQDAADTHVFWDDQIIKQYTTFYNALADKRAYLAPEEFQKRLLRDLQHKNTDGGIDGAGGQKFGCQVPCPAVADSINAWEACFSLFKVIAGPTNVYSGFGVPGHAWSPSGDVYNEGKGKRFISVAKVGVQFEKDGVLGDILCQTMPDEGFRNPDYVAGGAGILGKEFIDPNTDQPYKAIFEALGIRAKKTSDIQTTEILRGDAISNNARTRELLRRPSLDGLVLQLQARSQYNGALEEPLHNLDVANYYAIVKRQMMLELAAVNAQAQLMGGRAHHHLTGAGLGFFAHWAKEAVPEIYMRAFKDVMLETAGQFPNIAKIDVCWVGNPPYDKPAITQLFGPRWNNGNIGGIEIGGGRIGVHDLTNIGGGLIPSGTNGADPWAFVSNENGYASLEAAMGLTSDITSTQSSIYNRHLLDRANHVQVAPRRAPNLVRTDVAATTTLADQELTLNVNASPALAQSYLQLELNRLQASADLSSPKFSYTCHFLTTKGASIAKAAIVKWALEQYRFSAAKLQYKAIDGSMKQEDDWIVFNAIISAGSTTAQTIAINRYSGEMIGCVNAQGTLLDGSRPLTNAEIVTLFNTYPNISAQYPGVEILLQTELRIMAAAPAAPLPSHAAAPLTTAALTPTTPAPPAAARSATTGLAARRASRAASSAAGAGPAAAAPTTAKAIISYPAISNPAQAAYHKSWQGAMVAQKDALSDLFTTICTYCDSQDAMTIADLLTIVNFISASKNPAGATLSSDLLSLNFAASASNIYYDEPPLYTRHTLNDLKCKTPKPATSTFGALYEARMRDLALVLHKLDNNRSTSLGDQRIIAKFKEHFHQILSDSQNTKSEEVEVSLEEYHRIPRNTISLYRATNGEMCLKFSSKEERDTALRRFKICLVDDPTGAGRNFCTGLQYLPENNRFGITPCIVSGDDTSIFFPSYAAPKGEIGVNLGSKENKAALLQILNLEGEITARGTHAYYGSWQETSHTGKKPTADSPENSTLCKSFTSPGQDAALYFTAAGIMRPNATKSYRFCQDDSGEVVCVGLTTRPELVAAADAPSRAAMMPPRTAAPSTSSAATRDLRTRGAARQLSAQPEYDQAADNIRNGIREAISGGTLDTIFEGDTAQQLSTLATLASQDIPLQSSRYA